MYVPVGSSDMTDDRNARRERESPDMPPKATRHASSAVHRDLISPQTMTPNAYNKHQTRRTHEHITGSDCGIATYYLFGGFCTVSSGAAQASCVSLHLQARGNHALCQFFSAPRTCLKRFWFCVSGPPCPTFAIAKRCSRRLQARPATNN